MTGSITLSRRQIGDADHLAITTSRGWTAWAR